MHDTNLLEDQPIAWTPTPEVIERAQLTKFMRQVGVSTWEELYEYSIRDVENFTAEVLKFLDIKFNPPYEKLLDTSNGPEFPIWLRSGDTPVPTDAAAASENASAAKSTPTPERKGWYRSRKLPHFDGDVTQFITFRLADSLPQAALDRLKLELEHDKLLDDSEAYRERVEQLLDSGHGECILRDPAVAQIVAETLFHEDGKSCDLKAWVIMPNHAHILVRMLGGFDLGGLMKRVKGVSARRINQHLGRDGSVWQADYFDRYIRDAAHFEKVVKYIENNPVISRLSTTPEEWPFGSARSGDTLVPIADSSGENSFGPRSGVRGDKSVPTPSAGLNITEMCLDRWQTDEMKDQPAVIWEGEEGNVEQLTYADLFLRVQIVATGLRQRGLQKGHAIGIHLPMMSETVITLLAINRIGGIAVPVFSGYGVDAISSRLNAVGAQGLFTCDGFPRRGRPYNAVDVARAAISNSPAADPENGGSVFVVSRLAKPNDSLDGGFVYYNLVFDYLANAELAKPEPTSAEDPLIILYTSGTTGKPKGIAHTHASFPIKAAQDMAFGTDVGKGTRICWYTDIGWMMGPWLIYGALINGATICLYDGAPDYPTADRMWEFCAKHKVEVLGISPTLVRALAAHEHRSGDTPVPTDAAAASERISAEGTGDGISAEGTGDGIFAGGTGDGISAEGTGDGISAGGAGDGIFAGGTGDGIFAGGTGDGDKSVPAPHERHDLSSLRVFASTGEPWNPAPWWWLFEKVGNSKLPIINYSGGTEISGGILMGNPLLPIKPCSFPAPCPGMDVDILNEHGDPVKPGEVGELVIKQPWIGMARGFWQEHERYLETYWSRFENIWVHGDWAMRDNDGHWFILGRSDDTLKVAGKRVGPAEVESLLVAHPLVTEAAVIGVPDETKGTAMVAFCVLSEPGAVATGALSRVPSEPGAVATGDLLPSPSAPPAAAGRDLSSQSPKNAKQPAVPRPVGSVPPGQPDLEQELKALVAKDMGKPLAPSRVHFVSALPKTRNAKVMRRVIRAAYLGQDPGDLSALENPAVVSEIEAAGK